MFIIIRNINPKKNRVEVGRAAPIRWVILTNQSYWIGKMIIARLVNNHNKEYSSRSFLLRTNSRTNIKIKMAIDKTTIFCLKGISSPF